MNTDDDLARAEALVSELWTRILCRGEPVDEVLADMRARDAERRAAFEAERERLQGEIDAATVTMLACQGRLQ